MGRVVLQGIKIGSACLVIVPVIVIKMECLLHMSHNQTIDMPAGEIGKVLEEDFFDAFECFFASFELLKDEVLKSVSLWKW